jgi:hypothetical protein
MLLAYCATLFGTLILPRSLVVAQSNNDLGWVPFDRQQFNGSVALDTKGDVQLFWKTGDEYSTFGVASRSSGYLALGFSETGAMTGADMAVGYKDHDGDFILENRHAEGFFTPEVSQDQENNIRLKEGHQENGVTSFIFEKHNKADCLQAQVDVAKDSWQWFIYAFSNENSFAQHEPGQMGKKYVKLGYGKTVSINEIRDIANTKNFTIVQPELTIPTATTTYCYTLHKMPAGKKNYLLGERPNKSSQMLHHLVIYACYALADEYMDMLGKEPNCDWETFANPCSGFVTEWAPGMSGRTFEPGYGKPFGSDSYEYVMFETHYNNPEGIEGERDVASYTFLHTDKPVETEIGTLTLGDLQVDGWFLEPGKELVAHSTTCTPECTQRWPSEGITAVSVFHHMHYRGRNTRVQIIRDGKEIAPLSSLRDFEYGYQFSKSLDQIKLLPGDKFITTCEYDTSNDTQPVPGGYPSEDEMCFAWIDDYPANNVLGCTQYDRGDSSGNEVNGTAALCLENSAEDIYESTFLTSPFQKLSASGNICPKTSGTGGPSQTGAQSQEAVVLSTCPETDVCFSLNVPQQSASSGSGDIYFQLSAPTTYSWVALAQGTTMSDANMFLVYSSMDGVNVTLSARTAPGHSMPIHNDAADISLLDGSGISNGRMMANVRCGNCNKWSTSSMNFQGGNSDWMYAYLQGSPIDSDDTDAAISMHSRKGTFQWDLSQATGGSDTNPFTTSAATKTNSSSSTTRWEKMSTQEQTQFAQAHGALAAITFVAILPIGAILVRLARFNGLAWIHGGVQIFGYTILIAAAGLGIYIANASNRLDEPHAIVGMLLLAILFFMPLVGAIHHKVYKRMQKRTMWAYGHIFTGRAGIVLGMINGGLGLQLADARRSYVVTYSVFAGSVGTVYIAVIVFGEWKRGWKSSQTATTYSEPKRRDREGSDRNTSEEYSLT